MLEEDYPIFIQEFSKLVAYYEFKLQKNLQLNEVVVEAYWSGLVNRLSIDEFIKSCNIVKASSNFLPGVKDFIEAVKGDAKDKAILAYDIAKQTLIKHSHWQNLKFEDEAINATCRHLGSLRELRDRLLDTEVFFRKDFIETYMAFSRSTNRKKVFYLKGTHELERPSVQGVLALAVDKSGQTKQIKIVMQNVQLENKMLDKLVSKVRVS